MRQVWYFRNENFFDDWTEGTRCIPKASSHTRKELFDTEQLNKRRKAEAQAVEKVLVEEGSEQVASIEFIVR